MKPHWETTVNKWHARLHFGSEQVKSKMKIFNQTVWEQIDLALGDDIRVVEKSRMPWADSKRLDKDIGEEGEIHIQGNSIEEGVPKTGSRRYDTECYDDRPFYSMLLKSFITSSSGVESSQGMRGEDLEALRKYRRSKINVDRKASKGR